MIDNPQTTSESQAIIYHNMGLELIQLLGLKVKKNGRVDTSWGDKSPEGLARTVERINHDHLEI